MKAKIIKMNKAQTLRTPSGSLPTCKNAFDIVVNKCCASCAFKDLTRAVTLRRCMKHGKGVRADEVCADWTISEQLQMAGRSQGRVKRKEYLMYLVAVREEESSAAQMGLKTKAKSIEQIRAEFEREYGSIYMNI